MKRRTSKLRQKYEDDDSVSENEHFILFYSWKNDPTPRPSLEQMLQDKSEDSFIYNLAILPNQWPIIPFVWRNLKIVPGLPAIRVQRWKHGVLACVSGLQVEQLSRRAAEQSPEHLWEVPPAVGLQRGQCRWQLPPLSPEEAKKHIFVWHDVRFLHVLVLQPLKFGKITKQKIKNLNDHGANVTAPEHVVFLFSHFWSLLSELCCCPAWINECNLIFLSRSTLTITLEKKSGNLWRNQVCAALMRPRNIFTCWWRETRAPDSCSQMPTWG